MSRQRLVTAQDEERRKLERNLHDGAQQQLVALTVKLGLLERLVERDPSQAKEIAGQLQGDATDALEELRDLARGIYPPLLADKGLVAALESQARKSVVPVAIEADGIGRYAREAEAAVYFSCLEALQNVAKYASASRAVIALRRRRAAAVRGERRRGRVRSVDVVAGDRAAGDRGSAGGPGRRGRGDVDPGGRDDRRGFVAGRLARAVPAWPFDPDEPSLAASRPEDFPFPPLPRPPPPSESDSSSVEVSSPPPCRPSLRSRCCCHHSRARPACPAVRPRLDRFPRPRVIRSALPCPPWPFLARLGPSLPPP